MQWNDAIRQTMMSSQPLTECIHCIYKLTPRIQQATSAIWKNDTEMVSIIVKLTDSVMSLELLQTIVFVFMNRTLLSIHIRCNSM